MAIQAAKRDFGRTKYSSSIGPWYGMDDVDPDVYAKSIVSAFINNVLKPQAEVRWIGFKEIRYNSLGDRFEDYVDFMGRFFPNPYFVFNSRNVNDVKKSGWWKEKDEISVAETIEVMDRRFSEYANKSADRSVHLRHEMTVSNPESLLPFFEKIGEKMDVAKVRSVLAEKLVH